MKILRLLVLSLFSLVSICDAFKNLEVKSFVIENGKNPKKSYAFKEYGEELEDIGSLFINCSGVLYEEPSSTVLIESLAPDYVPAILKKYAETVDELIIRNCSEIFLNEEMFVDSNLKDIAINENFYPEIKSFTFRKAMKLKKLNLKCNKIELIAEKAFPEGIVEIDLSQNKIQVIKVDTFALSSLKIMRLDGNFIIEIEEKAFEKTAGLEELKISNNKIEALSPKVFFSLMFLKVLDLGRNKLKMLDNGKFFHTPNLVELKLDDNEIEKISINAFNRLGKLEVLDMGENKIEFVERGTFSHTPNLLSLNLGDNLLTNVPVDFSESSIMLKELNLDSNKIKCFGKTTFEKARNLEVLKMSRNKIDALESDAFVLLSRLRELHLNDNKIEKLENGTFANLNDLEQLDFSYNEIKVLSEKIGFNSPKLRRLRFCGNTIFAIARKAFDGLQDAQISLKDNLCVNATLNGTENTDLLVFCNQIYDLLPEIKAHECSKEDEVKMNSFFNFVSIYAIIMTILLTVLVVCCVCSVCCCKKKKKEPQLDYELDFLRYTDLKFEKPDRKSKIYS